MGRKEGTDVAPELASIPTSNKLVIQSNAHGSQHASQTKDRATTRVWRMCPFRNPARADGLILKHWKQVELKKESIRNRVNDPFGKITKCAPTLDSDATSTLPKVEEELNVVDAYTFAKVAPAIKIYRYSDDFYRYQIVDLDPSWTKEETDLLFDLCEMFELRFVAIHDRFKWRKDVTLEKLKHRYYTVTKRIVEFSFEEKIKVEMAKHNNPNHPVIVALREESARHPLVKYVYNMEHDRERRIMLERSFRITEEQKQEEIQLLDEIKEAESLFKREERKKSDLRKLKRKFNVNDDAIPLPTMEKLHSKDVWLASDIVASYKAQINPKHNEAVDEMLAALNISAPVVSSRASNELYCVVRGDAAIMINLVNKVDSLKKELEHWKAEAGPLVEQMPIPQGKEEKQSILQEHVDFPAGFQTPRPIVPPKAYPKSKPPMPQVITQQANVEEVAAPTVEAIKQYPEQQHDPQNVNLVYQQQMARQRMMMAQHGPPRPHMQQRYPMKLSPSGNSSPHSFPQQGPYGHMMPQHMGHQSPIARQRPSMHQMPQQGMHPSHPMMQQRRGPPQRMMPYPQYPQQPFQPGYQQQFAPMPMRPHPQGVFYPNQMYTPGPQPHYGHMMQHPMQHAQPGMHHMGQQGPQMQIPQPMPTQEQMQSYMQGQVPPQPMPTQGPMANHMQGDMQNQHMQEQGQGYSQSQPIQSQQQTQNHMQADLQVQHMQEHVQDQMQTQPMPTQEHVQGYMPGQVQQIPIQKQEQMQDQAQPQYLSKQAQTQNHMQSEVEGMIAHEGAQQSMGQQQGPGDSMHMPQGQNGAI